MGWRSKPPFYPDVFVVDVVVSDVVVVNDVDGEIIKDSSDRGAVKKGSWPLTKIGKLSPLKTQQTWQTVSPAAAVVVVVVVAVAVAVVVVVVAVLLAAAAFLEKDCYTFFCQKAGRETRIRQSRSRSHYFLGSLVAFAVWCSPLHGKVFYLFTTGTGSHRLVTIYARCTPVFYISTRGVAQISYFYLPTRSADMWALKAFFVGSLR